MTDDELNGLADIIVEKILLKQAEYDAEFVKQIERENGIKLEYVDTHTQMIEDEIVRLEKDLQRFLNNEDYEHAAQIVEQINKLKNSL